MAGQKRPIQDIYAEEEYPEEDYDDQPYDEQEVAAEEEEEDVPMQEFEEEYEQAEEEEAAAPPPARAPAAKRPRPAAKQPVKPAAPAPKQAVKKAAAPKSAAAAAPRSVIKTEPGTAQPQRPSAVVKTEPGTAQVAKSAPRRAAPASRAKPASTSQQQQQQQQTPSKSETNPVLSANSSSSAAASIESKFGSDAPLVIDAHTTVAKYLKKIDREYTTEQLKEKFEGNYVSNYELPSCLLKDFDATLLAELSTKAMRGDRKANKLFLRLLQAYELAKWLKNDKNVHIRGFASENTKKQGNNFELAEPLAGGEKRADQPHEPTDVVAKVVYIGDPFQYPQKDSPNKVVVPESDQKRLGALSCKSCIQFFSREQVININKQLDLQEQKRFFDNLSALQTPTPL